MDLGHLLLISILYSLSNGYKIDDEHLYKVAWNSRDANSNFIDTLLMQTSRGERYECLIPPLDLSQTDVHHNYTNNLKDVFTRLFQSQPCSTRVEYYWTYELCHNKHIRQFHEEQSSEKSNILQEYFLGFHSPDIDVLEHFSSKPPEILLGEVSYPYFKIEFSNGTFCDLTNSGRSTSVLYICHENIDGAIVQVSEVESCRYQLIFATKYLCANGAYAVQKRTSVAVTCTAEPGGSQKPTALIEFEAENEQRNQIGVSNLASLFGSAFKHLQIDAERRENAIVYHIRAVNLPSVVPSESESEVAKPGSDRGSSTSTTEDNEMTLKRTSLTKSLKDKVNDQSRSATVSQLLAFLRGHFCLTGHQTGWWTHELCFGKNVTQFHQVAHGIREQVIVLGLWDREKHYEWNAEHPNLQSVLNDDVSQRNRVLYYGNGDFCDKMNENRYTLVKLRCDRSANGIYLSFSEQKTCRYSVLVESAAFCDISETDWHTLVP